MAQISTLLFLLAFAVCSASSFATPPEKQQLPSRSAVAAAVGAPPAESAAQPLISAAVSRSRRARHRRQRIRQETRILRSLERNAHTLATSLRRSSLPARHTFTFKFVKHLRLLLSKIRHVRAQLYGRHRIRSFPRRNRRIRDENVLFVQTLLLTLRINRALKRRTRHLSHPTRRAINNLRRLAIRLNYIRFGPGSSSPR